MLAYDFHDLGCNVTKAKRVLSICCVLMAFISVPGTAAENDVNVGVTVIQGAESDRRDTENIMSREYYRQALTYTLRTKRDPSLLVQLHTVNLSAERNEPLDQIVEVVASVREQMSHKNQQEGESQWDLIAQGVGAAAGYAISRTPLGVAAGMVGSQMMKTAFDDYWSGDVPRGIRRLEEEYSKRDFIETVIDGHMETMASRSDIKEALETVVPDLPIFPSDDLESIHSALPTFHEFTSIIEIQDGVKRQEALTDLVHSKLNDLRESNGEALESIGRDIERANYALQGLVEYQYDAEQRSRQARIEEVRIEGVRSLVFLATTAIGLADPESGHRLSTVSSALFRIHDSIKKFNAAKKLADGLTGLASVALTGNIVAAIIPVLDLFVDMGPTADEMILTEIANLRKQVEDVRKQMHGRFDRVDRKLNSIHEDVVKGLNALLDFTARSNQENVRRLKDLRASLNQQALQLRELTALVSTATDRIATLIHAESVQPCLDRLESFGRSGASADWFRDCVGEIQSRATTGYLEQLQAGSEYSGYDLAALLRDEPEKSFNVARLRFLSQRDGQELITTPGVVPSPESWIWIADMHDRFMSDWPEYAEVYEGNNYGQVMSDRREAIVSYMESLRDDYVLFLRHEESALERSFSNARALVNKLERSIADVVAALEHGAHGQRWEDFARNLVTLDPFDEYNTRLRVDDQLDIEVVPKEECFTGDDYDFFRYWTSKRDEVSEPKLKKTVRRFLEQRAGLAVPMNLGLLDLIVCSVEHHWRDESDVHKFAVVIFMKVEASCGDRSWSKEYQGNAEVGLKVGDRVLQAADQELLLAKLDEIVKQRGSGPVRLGEPDSLKEDYKKLRGDIVKILEQEGLVLTDDGASAFQDLFHSARESLFSDLPGRDFEFYRCRETIVDRYERERRELSTDIERQIADSLQEVDKALALESAYLAAWMRTVLVDAVHRSDLLQSVLGGHIGFPSPIRTLREEEVHVWKLPDEMKDQLAALEGVLRSPHMQYLMGEHFGNVMLMRTTYEGIPARPSAMNDLVR